MMQSNARFNKLFLATYVYLALPLLIFILTWLDYAFALILGGLFIFAGYKTLQSQQNTDATFAIEPKIFWVAGGLAFIWCFCAGIGYFYYQSFDYHFRNAVFRDLINFDWPVMYDKAHTPMVYYMGFWLFPALITKITGWFISSPDTLFIIGNVYLLIYAVCGIMLIFLHLVTILKIQNWRHFLIAALIFILFSGLDIIGYLFFMGGAQPFALHLDWWAAFIQYSSLTTNMFWVFNQFIMTALAILLIFNTREIKNFGFLFPLLFFVAPYPAVGIGIFMITFAVQQFILCKEKKTFIGSEILTIPNLIGMFWLLPIIILYFITNSGGIDRFSFILDFISPLYLFIFMLLEFLLYAFILYPRYKKNIFFITAVVLLIIIPLFRLDQQNNFCMRVSVPALIVLSLFALMFLFESFKERKNYISRMILIALLCLGTATPLMEFYRGIYYVFEAKKINLVKDDIYTLNQSYIRMPEFGYEVNHQFTARYWQTDIFWQYIAKKY